MITFTIILVEDSEGINVMAKALGDHTDKELEAAKKIQAVVRELCTNRIIDREIIRK